MCSQQIGNVSPLNLLAFDTYLFGFTIKFNWILMLTDNGMPRSCENKKKKSITTRVIRIHLLTFAEYDFELQFMVKKIDQLPVQSTWNIF